MDDNRNSYSSLEDEMKNSSKNETDPETSSVTGRSNADYDDISPAAKSSQGANRGQNSVERSQTSSEQDSYEELYGMTAAEDNRYQNGYYEESSSELAVPQAFDRSDAGDSDEATEQNTAGTTFGLSALALSVLSLFIMPILFGAAGIVLGFVARRRGANTLGAWAIGVGAVSIIIGIFILPFF